MQYTNGLWNRVTRKSSLSYMTETDGRSVNEIFEAEGEKGRKQSKLIQTPPYVTARPDVSFRKIHRANEKLRFVILATDGRTSSSSLGSLKLM
jgi:serine/threonine protein phosphatase PrpC